MNYTGHHANAMKVIELVGHVTEDHKLVVEVPLEIDPGQYRVVVVIDCSQPSARPRAPAAFPVDDCGPWPENLSLRREDIYGDDGR